MIWIKVAVLLPNDHRGALWLEIRSANFIVGACPSSKSVCTAHFNVAAPRNDAMGHNLPRDLTLSAAALPLKADTRVVRCCGS
jgi:hypothetical protein